MGLDNGLASRPMRFLGVRPEELVGGIGFLGGESGCCCGLMQCCGGGHGDR